MSPILGIWASQISGHLWAPQGAYDALATVNVPSGGVSSIVFSGIPTGYKHLQIRGIMKASDSIYFSINSDTNNGNYYSHWLTGNGSSASASSYAGRLAPVIMAGTGASGFSAVIYDLLDYGSTLKNKTLRVLTGHDQNGSGEVGLTSMMWNNTSVVTSISIAPVSGSTISQYSQLALYGVK